MLDFRPQAAAAQARESGEGRPRPAGRFLLPAQAEAGREPQAAQDARRVVAEAGGVQGAQASLAQVALAAAGIDQLPEGRWWAELQGERVDAEITPPEVCFGAAGAHLWQLPGARVAFLARAGKIDRDSARREPLRGAEAGVRSQLAAEIGLDGAGEGDGVVERGAGQHQVQLVWPGRPSSQSRTTPPTR